MAVERIWLSTGKRYLISDGSLMGKITLSINDAKAFRVKMRVTLTSDALQPRRYVINRIEKNILYLGLDNSNINSRASTADFLLADNAYIENEPEQDKPKLHQDAIHQIEHEHEPVNGKRTILVDEAGEFVNETNPLPTTASISGLAFDPLFSDTPNIQNISIPLDNTEQYYDLPTNTKYIYAKIRNNTSSFKIGYAPNSTVSGNYRYIKMGNYYERSNLNTQAGLRLYFQTSIPNQTLELETWS
jgi:hypothetical protein